MVKQTIQIFARLKPTKSKTGLYEIGEDDDAQEHITVTVPRELAEGFINNKKENYKFRFEKVFDQSSKQDQIFEHVAQPVIENVLSGYNGTIFAYGQTASGKTFTITGGAERYVDRGIIPRTLSYIFEQLQEQTDSTFTIHISYLEIYNENGYDLLDPKHEASKLEDLPKVSLLEDADQNMHLKNLSVHQAMNEEEALNLLFLGDTNRMIAETPMNQASTRSHCLFTLHITTRETGSATIRRSKLHLVDLAGSERVHKSGVNGTLLTEAKYINLSLHFLEQVIVSLAEKNRQHIPYRNSMMTSVLRDSLGGNCMTTMIATCSVEKRNLDESISTMRFAQRVALIKNDAILNEELDPKLMIIKLKRDIQQLKEELAMATGEQRTDELTEEEQSRCEAAVHNYVEDTDREATLNVGADMRKIQLCYKIMKDMFLKKSASMNEASPQREVLRPDTGQYSNAETNRLKDLLLQRDNEINILVNMLKKEKKKNAGVRGHQDEMSRPPSATNGNASSNRQSSTNGNSSSTRQSSSDSDGQPGRLSTADKLLARKEKQTEARAKMKILGDMSVGRQEAFEVFRRDYEQNQVIDNNKLLLKKKYTEAKKHGERVNHSRSRINHLKSQIEQHRMQRAMSGLADSEEPDELEQQFREQIEMEKMNYKEAFNKLKELKTEIEHLQHFLEKSKVKLLKDFELWWAEQASLQPGGASISKGSVKSAWNTPPITPEDRDNSQPTSGHSRPGSFHNEVNHAATGQSRLLGNTGHRSANPGDDDGHHLRNRTSVRSQPNIISNIPLTGDSQADSDIMAFVRARQNILQQQHGPS